MYAEQQDFEEKLKGISSLQRLPLIFRTVAGSHLAECAPIGLGMLDELRPFMLGKDRELSETFLLDAIIIASAEKGEAVELVSENALKIAKMKGCGSTTRVDLETQRGNVYGVLGVEGYTVKASKGSEAVEEELESMEDLEKPEELEEPEELEKKEEKPKEKEVKDSELEQRISRYYAQYCSGVISELIKRYTSLFSSGYEVNKPTGLLTRDGIVKLSDSRKVIAEESVATTNMYDLMLRYLNFEEVEVRSIRNISNLIYSRYSSGSSKVLYFPNKLLEIAFGRCAPDGEDQESTNTYKKHSDSGNWSGYCKSELEKSVQMLVRRSVVGFVMQSMGEDKNFKDPKIVESLGSFLGYMQKCLSLCVLMVDYKLNTIAGEREISSFKIRICDPEDSIGTRDLTPIILDKAFLGGVGKVPFTYEPRIEPENMVKEYAHEFNHNVSQAMPLFAYKALEALQAQGTSLSWDNAILGMFEDGSILRNGSHGVNLLSKLCHQTDAGSRAGKGVMTLNFLASALASNKVPFYGDRKPDMASLLKYLAPDMCVINGGGYSEQYDMKYKQFQNINDLLNLNHIPKMVEDCFQTTPTWDELGDIVYMRFLKLVIGIIVARGEGKFSDPNFGGSDGILFIADEFKNFQDSFSNLVMKAAGVIPPTTIDKDRESLEKGTITQRTFDRSYNDAGFYALSFLNSLADDMKFLSEKTDAGFNQEEIALSDIIVIGQSLEKGMCDKGEFLDAIRNSPGSSRYRSAGSFGLKGFSMGNQSIPYTLVSFKPSDAFFGRNMDDGRSVYLAQTNKQSKAYGRLDDKASNFAYMSSFTEEKRKKIVGGGVADNIALANSCTYFKPFLILNTGDPQDDCVQGCVNRCFQNGGITKEELVAENPDATGTEMNPAIGFEAYLTMAGITNYREVLSRSSTIANYVVQNCLHYPGNWFEFITDLRPEWLFSIRDISEGAKGQMPRVCTPLSNPLLEEFVEFNPGYFGKSTDDGEEDYDDAMGAYFNDKGDTTSDFSDSESMEEEYQDRMSDALGDYDSFEEDEVIDLYEDLSEEPLQETGYDSKEDFGNDEEMEKILSHIEELRKLGVNIEVGSDGWSINNETKQYRPEGSTEPNKSEFGEDFSRIDYKDDITSLAQLTKLITLDVLDKFGGVERITSFKVIGGSIIINGYYYRCKIQDIYAKNIPYDIRREINSGSISKLFDYSMIGAMRHVRDLEFDSVSFVYDYVSMALGFGNSISVNKFFEGLSTLQVLTIGKERFTRDNYLEKIQGDDLFYKPRKATEIADATERIMGNISKSSWDFTRNVASSKNYGLALKVLGVAGGATVAGASLAGKTGTKLTRKAYKGLKVFSKGVKDLFNT